jgi:cardiolipin synthase
VVNLHRIEGQPEWAKVSPRTRSRWQRIAASTSGVVTIGNFFSLLGLLSVGYGLWLIIHDQAYIAGFIVLSLGRFGDLLDGWLADKTGTKSPLGELIDATFDKISIALIVVGLWFTSVIPWWALLIWILPHAITSVFALIAWLQGKRLHPAVAGKFGTATGWISMLAFIMSAAFKGDSHYGDLRAMFIGIALALLAITAILSLLATISYIRDFYKN